MVDKAAAHHAVRARGLGWVSTQQGSTYSDLLLPQKKQGRTTHDGRAKLPGWMVGGRGLMNTYRKTKHQCKERS